jgi:Tol biopolymer transport system component
VFLLDDDEGQGQQRVFFSSDPDGDWEIYTIRSDGTDVRQLTVNDAADGDAAFPPNPRQSVPSTFV